MNYKSVMSSPNMAKSVARLLLVGSLLIAAMVATLAYHPLFAQSQSGAIDTFTLESTNPGEIVVSWQAPSPSPSDYRVSWTPDEQDYVSWRDSNEDHRGNSYPDGDATSMTLTGLSEGTQYKVLIRARYRTGQHANNPWSGPWNEKTVTVASQPEPAATSTPEATPEPTPEPVAQPTPEPTPETPEGTVTGLTLSSNAPGSLTIEWDTPVAFS